MGAHTPSALGCIPGSHGVHCGAAATTWHARWSTRQVCTSAAAHASAGGPPPGGAAAVLQAASARARSARRCVMIVPSEAEPSEAELDSRARETLLREPRSSGGRQREECQDRG